MNSAKLKINELLADLFTNDQVYSGSKWNGEPMGAK